MQRTDSITDLDTFFHGSLFEMPVARFQEFEVVKKCFSESLILDKAKRSSEVLVFFKDPVAPKTADSETEIQASTR
jgi:hypothetical protein